MKITWLGHAGFRIEIADQILLIDPWMTGNPVFPEGAREEVIAGATHILLTHGHGDHATGVIDISSETGAPIIGIYDLMSHWEEHKDVNVVGMNKGGTVMAGEVSVTMVNAVHSSSIATDHGPMYAGAEAGFMISGEGHTIYLSGDTDVTADMKIFNDLHAPDIGILACGGHFTMDMERAAYAAKSFFDFKVVIPCHYKTFPLLAQSAQPLADALPGVDVKMPEVMETVEI